jgi:CheY-like chemotaxis protein
MPDAYLAGKRILVVEDEVLIALEMADRIRSRGGLVVGPVGHINAALRMAREEPLDGALLDVNLAGDLVYPVADALADRKIPMILVTGYSVDQLAERFRDTPKLPKPFPDGVGDRMLREVFGG